MRKPGACCIFSFNFLFSAFNVDFLLWVSESVTCECWFFAAKLKQDYHYY